MKSNRFFMLRLKWAAFVAAIKVRWAGRKALKLADKTGRTHYVAHVGRRIIVGDRKEICRWQQLIQKRTGKRVEWKDIVVAEAS